MVLNKMRKIINTIPLLYKIIILIIVILNIASFQAIQSKSEFDDAIVPFDELKEQFNSKDNFVISQPYTVQSGDYEIGINEKPSSENYIFFSDSKAEIRINNFKQSFNFDNFSINATFLESFIKELSISFFLLKMIQNFLSLILIVSVILVATLVLSHFKIKIATIVDSLLVSNFFAGIVSLTAMNKLSTSLQIILFVTIVGILHVKVVQKEMDRSITTYYLGEGV